MKILSIDMPLQNLENIIQASEEGVIYFSTGSMLLSETFHSEKLQAMFDAFSELSYTVLWKAKRERFPDGLNIPKNVHFQEWMPQLDIMCKTPALQTDQRDENY